uniref:Podocalyxin-like protein 2 n=1 Tax=Astyanax mexicanus TaxID=7994 RepID=A0A8B9KGN8_ASTMX
MPLFILGSSLLLLISADVLSAGPAEPRPLLDVPLGLEEHEGTQPGLMENSQESSGFFPEDSEENKAPRVARQWSVQGEVNTSLDADSLIGYNPSQPRLSSLSLRKEPQQTNSSSFFSPAGEAPDPERWESESSGFPLNPSSSSLSTTAASPLFHTAGSELSLRDPLPEATAAHDTSPLPEDEDRQNLLTQAPTAPEVGPFPSQTPLQPDDTRRDDSEMREEDEEVVDDDDGGEMVAFPTEVDGEEEDDWTHLTAGPSSTPPSDMPAVGFTHMSWQDVEVTRAGEDEEAELRHGGTEYLSEAELHDSQEAVQVICVDWSSLAGKGYVILNMSENYDCDEFRLDNGDRLLELVESLFSRKMNSPLGSWIITLSKPSRQERQLLMTLANEQGVIATKDVLSMLGEMRGSLTEVKPSILHP